MSGKPTTFTPAACMSACWHARAEGVAVVEYDECALVITRHPKTRAAPTPAAELTGDGTDLLDTHDDLRPQGKD